MVWADGDPRTEDGARNWVAVCEAAQHVAAEDPRHWATGSGAHGAWICVLGAARWKHTSGSQPSKLRTTPSSLRHMPPQAAGGQVRRRLQRQQKKRTPQRPFASEAVAGETAEAAAPEHTVAEAGNKTKKQLNYKLNKKLMVMLKRKKKPKKKQQHIQGRDKAKQ